MAQEIKINFTESDVSELLSMIQNKREGQETVFEWCVDGVDVIISVGNDEDED
jgi:hypothetical protein